MHERHPRRTTVRTALAAPVVRDGLSSGENMFSVRVINGSGHDQVDESRFVDPNWQPQQPSATVTSALRAETTSTTTTSRYTLRNTTGVQCCVDDASVRAPAPRCGSPA